MGHNNNPSAEGKASVGDDEEQPSWWKVALQKGLAGAAGESPMSGSPIAPIAPITTGIIDRIKARRAAQKATPSPTGPTW